MSFQYNQLKSKFKRLVIDFHHNKNKLGRKEHFIKHRDPTKLLLTLRTNQEDEEEAQTSLEASSFELEQNNKLFNGFTGAIGVEDAVGTADEENIPESAYLSERRRRGSAIPDDYFKISQEMLESHLRRLEKHIGKINYINRPPQARRKFWLFGKRLQPQIIPDLHTPKKIELEETDDPSIEILVQSTENQGKLLNSKVTKDEDLLDMLSDNEDELLLNCEIKSSSFSRKNSRKNASLVSLTRSITLKDQCTCPVCERKKLNVYEPWKVIMNDISLQAALLSTGSVVLKRNYSSGSLQSDFTNFKHKPGHQFFSKGKDLVFLDSKSFDLNNIDQIRLANDENEILESDLLDLSNAITLNSKDIKSRSKREKSRPSTNHTSKTSIISEKIELESSLVYDDVFQAYNYSDDKKNKLEDGLEAKPLNLKGRLKQIF